MPRSLPIFTLVLASAAPLAGEARAQRAAENAVTAATDAFGVSVGTERIGLYTSSDVRGFNPVTAGNRRIEGLYIDISGPGMTHNRALTGNVVRVGLPALAYPFPAPTGIVDYTLRTSNDRQGLSLGLARHPYGGGMVELDAQSPVVAGVLSVAAGAMYSSDRTVEDAVGDFHAFFFSPKINFGSGKLTAFWAHGDSRQETRPLVVTPGALLPPDVESGDFYGQRWAISQVRQNVVGLLGRYEISEHLTLRGGLFDARTVRPESATPIFANVRPDGSARELVAADGELRGRWTSGEVRLAYERTMGTINHALIASVRGRDRFLTNGETPPVDLGMGAIGVYRERPKPEIAFAPSSSNEVQQLTGGLAYLGRWRGMGELNVGLQKTRYATTVRRSGAVRESTDTPWLYNATIAVTPRDWLAIYAGYARGLEESAAVPQSAVNRGDILPAAQTIQRDAGVRLALGPMRFVAGVFEVEKPYYALDQANVFAEMGQVRHRGAELSLTGAVTDRLTAVAGLVLMSPRVTGEARDEGRVGERPVGTAGAFARIDLDYRIAPVDGLSVNLAVSHSSERIASSRPVDALGAEQLTVPAFTTVDLGVRYRFKMGESPAMVRVVASNIFDERGWKVISGNTFQQQDSRRIGLYFTADL